MKTFNFRRGNRLPRYAMIYLYDGISFRVIAIWIRDNCVVSLSEFKEHNEIANVNEYQTFQSIKALNSFIRDKNMETKLK